MIAPCRPRTPEHKGKVEQGGVHYVKRNFLGGRQPTTIIQANQDVLAEVEPFAPEAIEPPLRALAKELELKAGQLFGIVRWAVTGRKVAPPLFGSLAVMGQERVLKRLDAADAALAAVV